MGGRERLYARDHGGVAVTGGKGPGRRWRRARRHVGIERLDWGGEWGTGDGEARVEGGEDGEIVADVEDTAGEGDAEVAVVGLKVADAVADLVERDVVALAGVGL